MSDDHAGEEPVGEDLNINLNQDVIMNTAKLVVIIDLYTYLWL